MFQSISFTFLCALAFISWTVLCYLHVVEEQKKSDDYNIEIYTERSHFDDVPQYCPIKSTQTIFLDRIYELLVSYGLILATTMVLCKILQFLELEAMSYLQREAANLPLEKASFPSIELNTQQEETLEVVQPIEMTPSYAENNWELREQLDDLQARCLELLQELRAVNSSSTSNDNENYDLDLDCSASKSSFNDISDLSISTDSGHNDNENSGLILWKQPRELQKSSGLSVFPTHSELTVASSSSSSPSPSMLAQNVYVTHSHIHINFNGSVRLSQENIDVGSLRLKNMPKSSEFRQVWGKCLKGPNEIPMLTGINTILM